MSNQPSKTTQIRAGLRADWAREGKPEFVSHEFAETIALNYNVSRRFVENLIRDESVGIVADRGNGLAVQASMNWRKRQRRLAEMDVFTRMIR